MGGLRDELRLAWEDATSSAASFVGSLLVALLVVMLVLLATSAVFGWPHLDVDYCSWPECS